MFGLIAGLAQLARALPCQGRGREFESLNPLQFLITMTNLVGKLKSLVYFTFPFFFLGYMFFIFEKDNRFYWKLIEEDGWIENAQAGFFLLSALIGFYSLKRLKFETNLLIYLLLFGLNSLLLFCFFEEISWGQRIFGFETNEYFQKHNFQNETNLHNLAYLKKVQFWGFSFLGFWGSIMSFIAEVFFIKRLPKLRTLIVSKKLFFYFFPTFFFYAIFINIYPSKMGVGDYSYFNWKWQEPYELLLTLGFLLYTLENITRRKIT